jgi:hypothetical protein
MIKDKKCNAGRVSLFKYRDCLIDLSKELHVVPPWVSMGFRIYDAACILHYPAIGIVDNQSTVVLLHKV